MAVLSTPTKGRLGIKTAKTAAKHRGLTRLGLKAAKPLARRRVRTRAEGFGETARSFGETFVAVGVPAAYRLGLVEPPKPKRTAPRVAAGMVIGAGAVYFLEPEHGREHREKVLQLVS